MLKKVFALLLIGLIVLNQGAGIVMAEEAMTSGEAQTAQEAEAPKEDKEEKIEKEAVEAQQAAEATPVDEPTEEPTPAPENAIINYEGGEEGQNNLDAGGNVGDTNITTGDANNNGNIINNTNTNLNLAPTGTTGTGGSASIVNTGNGANSDNTGSATIVGNNDTNQQNSAVIINNMTQASVTGQNDASKNVGNTSITTGDANVSGTIITAANTNVDGVAVSEFNIIGDHNGDYLLDFGANCIAGCVPGDLNIANKNNGSGSDNTGLLDTTVNNTTNQINDGTVINNINLIGDSGSNDADKNTGGDTSITTGDANVAANLMTFLNNNIAGGVMFGVVNIFGDLVGDIILPENVFSQFACGACAGDTNVTNSGNGSDTNNTGIVNDTTNNNIFQANDATITNNLYLEAETGDNSVTKNTNGDNSITTGDTNVDASILNMANMNMIGGNMWLVIVNEAGNWIGKLFGAPEGSQLAASEGLEFSYAPNGQINVTNSGNGSGSDNSGTVNNTTNNNLNQQNTANVVNNVNLLANTGRNSADKNTGGNSSIVTGDAEAIANIVNFVNNNIAGGKLLVTFVNVFGSWNGDFLTPGAKKDASPVVVQGGVQEQSNNNSSNNQASSNGLTASAKGANTVAAAGFTPTSIEVTNSGNENNIKVAGISNNQILAGLTKDATSANSKKTLNLAWALLALPMAGAVYVLRRRYLNRTA